MIGRADYEARRAERAMLPPRTFPRTAIALRAYEAAGEALDAATNENAAEVVAAWDAALQAVGEAFAADTIDINPNGVGLPWKHFHVEIKFARSLVAEGK